MPIEWGEDVVLVVVPTADSQLDVVTFGAPVANAVNDHEDRITALETNVWLTLSLGAGWTGTFKYRTVGPYQLQLFVNCTPGTKTDGTTIGTLSVGYRPTLDSDVCVACNVMAGGSAQAPHLGISASTGNISCWGLSAAGSCSTNIVMALDP